MVATRLAVVGRPLVLLLTPCFCNVPRADSRATLARALVFAFTSFMQLFFFLSFLFLTFLSVSVSLLMSTSSQSL